MRYATCAIAVVMIFGLTVLAQDPPAAQEPPAPAGNGGQPGAAPPRAPRPYEQVITSEAKTDKGVFDVHKVGETYYYEIPKAMLGKEFLWVTQIQKNTLGAGFGGAAVGDRVVRWERQGNRIFLRNIEYDIVADKGSPVARAVAEANNDTIVMAFNVEANGPEESSVIDVTRLFATDVPEITARARLRGRGMDTGRSFIEKIVSYPENIEAQASHTYTSPTGEPYNDLQEIYGRLLGQWVLEMNHVAAIVGGLDSQQKHIGQEGVRFSPVSRERQVAAVKFLHENAFKVPVFAASPDILRRIEPVGVLDRVKTSQTRVLTTLLENARIGRLIEQEVIDGAVAYRATDFFTDVRKGIWSELNAPQVKIDAYRRNLQRSYLDVFNDKLNGRTPANNDIRAFVRGELATLRSAIAAALGKTSDRATQLHLQDARDQIAKILDPKFQAQIGAPGGAGIGLMATRS